MITFLMPIFNGEKYLRYAIESLLKQTSPLWELYCIDDESTDSSLEIITSYAAKDTRIHILQQKNTGPGVARANAILHVKTPYCAILDADDSIEPQFVEKTIAKISKKNYDVIVPAVEYIDENNNFLYNYNEKFNIPYDSVFTGGENALLMTIPWRLHGWIVFRTEFASSHYCYENVHYSKFNSDEYATRLIYLRCREIATSTAKYLHRINTSSITHKVSISRLDYLRTLEKLLDLIDLEDLSLEIRKRVYDDFMLECVRAYKLCRYLDLEQQQEGRSFVKKQYGIFQKRYFFAILKQCSFREAIYHCFFMSGYINVKIIVWFNRIKTTVTNIVHCYIMKHK